MEAVGPGLPPLSIPEPGGEAAPRAAGATPDPGAGAGAPPLLPPLSLLSPSLVDMLQSPDGDLFGGALRLLRLLRLLCPLRMLRPEQPRCVRCRMFFQDPSLLPD